MILKDGMFLGPYWGKSTRTSGGRDHLGMWASSIATYGYLLPGLTNQTRKVRYYSFYAWFINAYHVQLESKSQLTFWQLLRRAELLFAFSNYLSDSKQQGYPGINFIKNYFKRNTLPSQNRYFEFAQYADIKKGNDTYWKNKGGALRLYYIAPLRNIGITTYGQDGTPCVTEVGKVLSGAFEESITTSNAKIFLESILQGEIKTSLLTKIRKKLNCFPISATSVESKELVALLFDSDSSYNGEIRRQSLLSLLHYIKVNKDISDSRDFPKAVYYSCTPKKSRLKLNDQDIALLWQFYQINEYSHFALEMILDYLLKSVWDAQSGWVHIDECVKGFKKDVLQGINKILPSVNKISGKTLIERILKLMKRYNNSKWDQKGSPNWIIDEYQKNKNIAASVLLIFSLLARHKKEIEVFKRMPSYSRVYRKGCFVDVFEHSLSNKKMSLDEFLEKLLCVDVIRRHLYIAYKKLAHTSIDTLKFRFESNALSWVEDFKLAWTNPRIGSVKSFLRDLEVLDSDNQLTSFGRKLYEDKS